MQQSIAIFGYFVLIGLAWLASSHRARFPWRIVCWGTALQFSFATLILRTGPGKQFFDLLGAMFTKLISFADTGSSFLFGDAAARPFAFSVLPIIIFFSALTSVLYHLGVMQLIVRLIAWVMQRTLGISGAESLSAAANIFVGQTEAPLVVKPYLAQMTRSELMAIMVGGFATIAGSVMGIYVSFKVDAGHLLTASVISAPAGLLIAKVLQPETELPQTMGSQNASLPKTTGNLIEAISNGASDGLMLMLNVAAMLVAFISLIALVDFCLEGGSLWIQTRCGAEQPIAINLAYILGWLFAPIAWLMGIAPEECRTAGELLGIKVVATEFVAYQQLSEIINSPNQSLSPRSIAILTYALCGFSNFASIGIQVGGIGALAPERRRELTQISFKAMIGGTIACCMTGCVAAVLLADS